MYKYVYRKKSKKRGARKGDFRFICRILSPVFFRIFSSLVFSHKMFFPWSKLSEENRVKCHQFLLLRIFSHPALFYFIQQFQWWQIASVPSHNITGFFREKKSFIRDVFEEWNYSRNKGGNEPERLPKEHTVLFGCLPYSDGAYNIVKSVKTNFFLSFHLHHFHVRCPPRPSLGPWLILQSLTPS